MPDVRPFRGFRYDLGFAGVFSDLIAPPYDVVDADLRARLLAKSRWNAAGVEVPHSDDPRVEAHTAAAREFNGWLSDGVVRQDSARCVYVLEQEFTTEAGSYTRRGFLARVRLEPVETGRIFRHEETLPRPKAERLSLYTALGFNVSPVFGLYPDPGAAVAQLLEPHTRNAPPLEATGIDGVVNRLWPVSDQTITSRLAGILGPQPLTIADGHHRYETALNYLAAQRELGRSLDDDSPANFCLMHLVAMSDPGLVVLPTHRLARGFAGLTSTRLKELLAPEFDVLAELDADLVQAWDAVQSEGGQGVLGFVTPADGRALVVRLRSPESMAALAPERSAEWRQLSVSVLHKLVFDKLLASARTAELSLEYVHTVAEVGAGLAAGAELAALVPAVPMDSVEYIAAQRELMPPKSTYFYPKVPAGLVYYSLKRD